jgi:hypothetical protein
VQGFLKKRKVLATTGFLFHNSHNKCLVHSKILGYEINASTFQITNFNAISIAQFYPFLAVSLLLHPITHFYQGRAVFTQQILTVINCPLGDACSW